MREGADLEAPTVPNSGNSRKFLSSWTSFLLSSDGRGFGLKVEKDLLKVKACSSSSRSCRLWTASRLLPNLCDVFSVLILFDF